MMGCASCVNSFTRGGFVQCRKKPHDFETTEQRSIVEWLKHPGRNAMVDPGCPGHNEQEDAHGR